MVSKVIDNMVSKVIDKMVSKVIDKMVTLLKKIDKMVSKVIDKMVTLLKKNVWNNVYVRVFVLSGWEIKHEHHLSENRCILCTCCIIFLVNKVGFF